jgi:mannose-1-phosphate guanylyltransferase/mannose-6-phosphate isomerase
MLQIVGEDTLIRQTIKRMNGFVPPENIWIVTTEDKAQDIRFHLESLGSLVERIQFIKEPVGRNTAPALGLAAIYLQHFSSDSVMIVMPSDHAIPDNEKYLGDLKVAIEAAMEDCLVTFGIKPNRPETGYGYIKVDHSSKIKLKGVLKVECFVEKPNLETAKKYLLDGNYFWNSGIFVWKTSKILSEIKTHLPSLYKTLKEIDFLLFKSDQLDRHNNPVTQLPNDVVTSKPNKLNELYSSLENISIDYGIMERSSNGLMVPANFLWSDLGSWTALDEMIKKDDAGNIVKGNTIDIGSENSTIFAGERLIATIGLKDMVVVDTPDATLVTPKGRVQEVKNIVEELKKNGREEHLIHKTVERPWGSYTVLEKGNGYKIKRVVLKPGAKLSLQLHRRRSEHWVVVSGVAKVTRESETYLVHSNESTYIPINTKHRLENPGKELLQIIEVQNGDYVEENDIERFSDDYGRI